MTQLIAATSFFARNPVGRGTSPLAIPGVFTALLFSVVVLSSSCSSPPEGRASGVGIGATAARAAKSTPQPVVPTRPNDPAEPKVANDPEQAPRDQAAPAPVVTEAAHPSRAADIPRDDPANPPSSAPPEATTKTSDTEPTLARALDPTEPANPTEVPALDPTEPADPTEAVAPTETAPVVDETLCRAACDNALNVTLNELPDSAAPSMRDELKRVLVQDCPTRCVAKASLDSVRCIATARSALALASCPL